MTFLEKLEMLMADKKINKRQFALGSQIPYSTIDNLWKTGYENIKLSNLKKISNYFGVSLDFLVRDNIEDQAINEMFLSDHERKLIVAYRSKENMRNAVDTLLGISNDNNSDNSTNDIAADEASIIQIANKAFTNIHIK